MIAGAPDTHTLSQTLFSTMSSYPMIPVEEAISKVLSACGPLAPVEVDVTKDGLGQILACDVTSKDALPPFPASIMDGYAVVASDGPGAG